MTAAQMRDYQQENNDCVANLGSKICCPRRQKFATIQTIEPCLCYNHIWNRLFCSFARPFESLESSVKMMHILLWMLCLFIVRSGAVVEPNRLSAALKDVLGHLRPQDSEHRRSTKSSIGKRCSDHLAWFVALKTHLTLIVATCLPVFTFLKQCMAYTRSGSWQHCADRRPSARRSEQQCKPFLHVHDVSTFRFLICLYSSKSTNLRWRNQSRKWINFTAPKQTISLPCKCKFPQERSNG